MTRLHIFLREKTFGLKAGRREGALKTEKRIFGFPSVFTRKFDTTAALQTQFIGNPLISKPENSLIRIFSFTIVIMSDKGTEKYFPRLPILVFQKKEYFAGSSKTGGEEWKKEI